MKNFFHIFFACALAVSNLPAHGMWRQGSRVLIAAAYKSPYRLASSLSRQQPLGTRAQFSTATKIDATTSNCRSALSAQRNAPSSEQQKTQNYSAFKRVAASVAALCGIALGHEKIFAQGLKNKASVQAENSADLPDLNTLKAFYGRHRLQRLQDNDPEKIAAKEELLAYIKAAEVRNSIPQLCYAVRTYHILTNRELIPLDKFTNDKRLPPTLAHLYATYASWCSDYIQNKGAYDYWRYEYIHNKSLGDIVTKVVEHERSCLNENEPCYSYVHAHRWSHDLAQRVHEELCPSSNKEFFPLYFLTLTNRPSCESLLIKLLKKTGNPLVPSDRIISLLPEIAFSPLRYYERYLLSVNSSFFGNSDKQGESTACYLAQNRSISPPDLTLHTLFNKYGSINLYTKYELDWKKIEQLHADSSRYGKLWLIKIPKKVHQQLVIPSKPLGCKSKFSIDGKKTDDVNYIQDTLRTRPEAIENVDAIQFRILMTPSTGLNPDLGIKTIPLHCADPVKYAEFEKAFDVLITKVKADILAQEKSRASINQGRSQA